MVGCCPLLWCVINTAALLLLICRLYLIFIWPHSDLFCFHLFLFSAEHGPCHGPLQPPHCHRHHSGGGGGGGGSGGSGGGGSGGSGGGGSGYSDDTYGQSSSYTDDASWGSDGHSSATSESSTTSARNEQANSSGILNPASISFWMLIAAAAAVALAIGAVIVGSRRKEKENYHPLRGAVEKRMRLFGGFTDKCFGDRELCGADREVEIMENSIEEGGSYRQMR